MMESPVKALWFIIFIIVLQQFEGNVIYPRLMGKSIGLPAIWILFAVTMGGAAFGIVGMLLAVPFVSIIYTLLKEAVNNRLEQKEISDEKLS
jgi:predicted PurR-regulated permease PerM